MQDVQDTLVIIFCVCGILGTTLAALPPLLLPLLGCELKSLTAGREATTQETGIEEKGREQWKSTELK